MKKEEVNKQIKEVVRPNGKGEINGNNLQETLLLMSNNAANDEDTISKLNLKANQEETDEKLALKADKTSVYTKEEANALLDLKVNINDYEADKEVSSKEKQEFDVKLTQTKQELDSVKSSLSHMGNGVIGEAKGDSVINLPENAMKSVVPNYKIEGFTDVEGAKSVQLPMRVKSVGENLCELFYNKRSILGKSIDLTFHRWSGEYLEMGNWGVYTSIFYKVSGEYSKRDISKLPKLHKNTTYYFNYKTNESYSLQFTLIDREGNLVKRFNKNSPIVIGNKDLWVDIQRSVSAKDCVVSELIISKTSSDYIPYTESNLYINSQLEIKSVGEVFDYIENGKLYKNVGEDGEILEETEVINLNTSGLIEANPNGTVFFEPITNLTGFYDNGLEVEGLDILEVEEFSHLVNGVYQSLDVSKVKVEGGKLTHPDAQNGIVYLVYRYDDNAVWGENTISYYNSDKTLKSPNGKIWKKVETATDTGELVVTLEEVTEEIVEP